MKLVHNISKFSYGFLRKRFYNQCLNLKKVDLPRFVGWDCTRRCNLHCQHCGAAKETYSEELSTCDVIKVLDDLSVSKNLFFAVTGGEPLLRSDLIKILTYAKSKGFGTGIASNGFLIDMNIAKEIRKAKVDSIQISLDGEEITHNKIRGNDKSFNCAIQALENLQKVKIPLISVATTITPTNFKDIQNLYQILIDINVKIWRICIVMPIGRACENSNLLLNSDQLKYLFKFIEKENHRKMYIYWGENLTYLAEYETLVRDTVAWCPAGITACCIGVNGNVRGCPEQPDDDRFIEGNIREKSILDIWQNGFKRYRLNEFITKDYKCSQCNDKYNCYGGCHVMRLNHTHCIYDLIK